MARRILLFVSTATLLSLVSLSIVSNVAQASTSPVNFPGTVKCNATSGAWNGVIRFTPALMNGGTASTETMVIKAALGNSASPCITTSGTIALGTISGTLKFNIAGSANNCATIFSGAALPAPTPGSLKMIWTTPGGGNPTLWTQTPNFNIKGAASMANIVIKNAKVTGSFTPFGAPKATLSDSNWTAAVPAGCASSTGLSSLTLFPSSGKW